MKNQIKNIALIVTSTVLFASCVNDSFETPKQDCVSPGLMKTKEVADIYSIAIAPTGTPIPNTPTYTADDIIEGYVVSSDEGGNFYQKLYVQPTTGGKGFYVSINEGNLYTKHLQPGKKVYLKLKGLAYGNPTTFDVGLVFGLPPTDKYTVDRIPSRTYKDYVVPSCELVNEDTFVNHITLAQAKAANNNYLNTLVEFDNVQFETDGITYDPDRTDTYDASINITDGTTSFVIRTDSYANFAGNYVPSGKGKIRGVLTKYNSTYQLVLRTERDVKMTQPRVDYALPIGGTAITYSGAFSENFESYATTSNGAVFPKYVNDAYVGSRYWDVKSYSGNKYIQMSAYGSGGNNVTYLAMPIDFTAANNLSFQTKDGYNNGNVLKVYYSTNYVPLGDISQATLIDITSNFTIASGTVTGYASSFTNSGTYAIPASITGNGFIFFQYSGNPSKTTTIQIDNVLVN